MINGVEQTQGAPFRTSGSKAMCPALINMPEKYKIVQDPVNGPIKVGHRLIGLLDTKEIQRLRQIKQLGMVYMVFPGAQHTRFEHSLGSMHLAGLMANNLGVEDKEAVMAAALLHDVGHPPFSHTFEEIIEKKTGLDHQEAGYRLITGKSPMEDSSIPDILIRKGFDPQRIAKLATGNDKSLEGRIVSGTIDCDELDYLRRDAYFCGTTLGIVDHMRVLESILADSDIYIEDKGVPAVEELLVARMMMYRTVYWHKTARIAQNMLGIAVTANNAIDSRIFTKSDHDLLSLLRKDPAGSRMVDAVLSRILYKPILKIPYKEETVKELREILEEQVELGKVIIDVMPPEDFVGSDRIKDQLRVKIGKKFIPLNQVSALSRSLEQSFSSRSILVTSQKSVSEKVSKIINSVLPQSSLSS